MMIQYYNVPFSFAAVVIIMIISVTNGNCQSVNRYNDRAYSANYQFENDTLIVSTGLVTRKWLHTSAGLLTISYIDEMLNKEWCNPQKIDRNCDWYIPSKMDENTLATLVS
jgi:hypothetical protein